MEEILNSTLSSSIAMFITQMVYIYLKTLNVIYTSERNVVPAMITNVGVNLAVLFSFAIGTRAMITGDIITILSFLLGGTIGTCIGIKQSIKRINKNLSSEDKVETISFFKRILKKKKNKFLRNSNRLPKILKL